MSRRHPRSPVARRAALTLALALLLPLALLAASRLLAPQATPPRAATGPLAPGQEWLTILRGDQSVGHQHLQRSRRPDGGWQWRSALHLDLRSLGQAQTMDLDLSADLDAGLDLESFRGRLRSGESADLELSGRWRAGGIELTTVSAGDTRSEWLPLDQRPTLEMAARARFALGGLSVGRSATVAVFDPLSRQLRALELQVAAAAELDLDGGRYSCFVLQESLAGLSARSWVDPAGLLLQQELPLGLRAQRQAPGATARPAAPRAPAPDLAETNAVPLRGAWSEAAPVRLRLVGPSPAALLAPDLALQGGRQDLSGLELTLRQEELPGTDPDPWPAAVAPPPELAAALRPEPLLQSDAPELQRLATALRGDARGRAAIARKLVAWVAQALEKRSVLGLPSALEVLQRRQGDCNEHTTLFVALARAAGVPARPLAGLVLLPERGRFYYHAWAEVELGDGWVEVDPTYGELPASLRHLRLVRGGLGDQVPLLRLMGQVQGIERLPAPEPP